MVRSTREAAGRVTEAVGAVADAVVHSAKRLDWDGYKVRVAICKSGRCGVYGGGVCGTLLVVDPGRSCGCLVTVKAWLAEQHCPQGLWPGDDGIKPLSKGLRDAIGEPAEGGGSA